MHRLFVWHRCGLGGRFGACFNGLGRICQEYAVDASSSALIESSSNLLKTDYFDICTVISKIVGHESNRGVDIPY